MDSTIDSQHEDLLPICTTVGYTVNLLPQADPGEEITVPGSSTKYWLPENFEKHETGSKTVNHSLICRTGTELANELQVNSKVSANYFGFSAEASAGYEYSTNFKSTSLYGIYSLDQKNYSINVTNKQTIYDSVEDEFIDAAAKLPAWKTISKDLKDFDEVTSIYNSVYGYQLKVEQNELTEEDEEKFSTNVKAEYQGAIGVSVSVDAKYTESYKHYTSQRQSDCNVLGGDAGKAGTLAHLSPDDADAYNAAFKEWQESREEGSTDALLHIRVVEIGNFLKDSYVKSQLAVADRLSSAWSYFKDFYTFQGQLVADGISKGDVVKLEITPLPGLEIRFTKNDALTVTQTKANSVEVTCDNHYHGEYLDVTIVAPDRPVQLLLSKIAGNPSLVMILLQLNQCGPDDFRTIYDRSDARQNASSFRDPHESWYQSRKVVN
ncbi:uncharacterized protein EAE98_002071 [Botrytis deweyae]|uniref:MACPF domain-containing protein n=1 Tax=Botrytis deweyae TaxID=2478750 RepID=A0ABQ7IW63_9HELO|nr:uncharacterized protein EAE98_002071 [Botrytis deweyae]KAF7935851.1 hypothetical protein EAE98_002071 [Botrytis deweyae]